jgi:hypothetical protein
MNTFPALDRHVWLAIAAAASLASAGGCSSGIGSAYLREAWLDAVEHAAETRAAKAGGTAATEADDGGFPEGDAGLDGVALVTDDDAVGGPTEGVVRSRFATLDEAVAHADRQLESSGGLSSAARDTLTTMLQTVPRQDWPVVVDEFTATLSAAVPTRPAAAEASAHRLAREPVREPAVDSVPDAPLPPTQPAATAAAPPATSEPPAPIIPAAIVPAAAEQPAAQPVAEAPAPQPLTLSNACFATRVRGWGAVDRFEHSRFAAGQEVIVYFEIEELAARRSPEGHTTRIDTRLRLVGEDGRTLHEWAFEPLEETCLARRRDYFARYVLTLPEAAPAGPCRIEIGVTDAVGGRTAQATLPLELQAR